MENFRQSAAQSRSRRVDVASAGRMDGAAAQRVLDADGAWHPRHSFRCGRHFDLMRKPTEVLLSQHFVAALSAAGPAFRPGVVHAGVSSLRGLSRPRCDSAHPGSDAGHASRAAGVEPVTGGRSGSRTCNRERSRGSQCVVSAHVDRAADGTGCGERHRGDHARCAACSAADSIAVVRFSCDCMVVEPAASPAAARTQRRSAALPATVRPPDPGHSSRPLSAPTTIGCRRTTFRNTRSPPSLIARPRPTWGSPFWPT